jgi:hypothetical protein
VDNFSICRLHSEVIWSLDRSAALPFTIFMPLRVVCFTVIIIISPKKLIFPSEKHCDGRRGGRHVGSHNKNKLKTHFPLTHHCLSPPLKLSLCSWYRLKEKRDTNLRISGLDFAVIENRSRKIHFYVQIIFTCESVSRIIRAFWQNFA